MYEWIMERTADQRVKDYLRASVTDECRTQHGPVRYPIPKSLPEISSGSRVAEWRLKGCLKRLKRKDFVSQDGDNWKILT